MITIHKYPLDLTDLQMVQMPEGAQLLTVQLQGNTPMLWALVEPGMPTTSRIIRLVGTGNPIPEPAGAYIATVQMWDGRAVWHVFEAQP